VRSFADPAQTIRVAADETFAIELAGAPTTGYTWHADADPQRLELVGQEYRPGGAGIGAGGQEVFRFRALASGQTEVRFVYSRPWGGTGRDTKRFRVVIV
jgi:inhibitor of cysteine peptidase